jgi:cobyric acid synthase
MRIGLTEIKGALPGFETFGNLPTDIVKSNGLVNGVKANEVIDCLIIPGGSIIESESVTRDLSNEIKRMSNQGKPIIGICSGFQVLAKTTDVGRKSPCPIKKEGIGLLDVNFSPLISNDRVTATTTNHSFLTIGVEEIRGFHCHTYGKIENNETEIMYSQLKRVNYSNEENKIISAVKNDAGNIIGTLIHGILDNNPKIVDNLFNYLGANEKEIEKIYNLNKEFKNKINKEIAIDSNITVKDEDLNCFNILDYVNKRNNKNNKDKQNNNKTPLTLMIGSTGSESGKTFITTGIAGNLKKLGLNVAVLKIGPDIRDTVPSLYLTKGLMEDYASIKIGHLGWMEIKDVLERLKDSNYDFVLIEGAMSMLIGLLKETTPFSCAEIAASSNIPILMVSSVSKGGIESSAIDLISHINTLKSLNIDVKGIILNKVYDNNIFNEIKPLIEKETGINKTIAIPKVKMDERSSTPEVEIKLEDFSLKALETISKHLNLESIVKMSENPVFNDYLSFEEIKKSLF